MAREMKEMANPLLRIPVKQLDESGDTEGPHSLQKSWLLENWVCTLECVLSLEREECGVMPKGN